MKLPYFSIPSEPRTINAACVLARMVDGLGFRYYWATEGLRKKDLSFRCSPESFSVKEVMFHILQLCAWMDHSLGGKKTPSFAGPPPQPEQIRASTLGRLQTLSRRLKKMKNTDLKTFKVKTWPFWYLINGPLADALTHVGQINAWRRQSGNPAQRVSFFQGTPPKT